jgi:peptidoglycan/xylan/chitin deacetylase (PgdA/CDA1 family)
VPQGFFPRSLVGRHRGISIFLMGTILLTWDIEEYDLPADFGAAGLSDGGLAQGGQIWRDWLKVTKGWSTPGTVFCTARLADANPELLHQTAARGYEIGSHGWEHTLGADLRLEASRELLQKNSRQPVFGFRAPRLRPVSLASLAQAGYRYDASSNPAIVPGRYCRIRDRRTPHRVGSFWKVPASVLPLIRLPLFWASFHLFPLPLYQAACRMALATDGVLSLYFHPWELSELSEPQLPAWLRRRSQHERIDRMAKLVRWLGTIGTFRTISDYLKGIRVTRP